MGRPKGSMDKKPRGGQKLTETDVVRIRDLYSSGLDYTEIKNIIEESYSRTISRQNIEQIITGRIWKSVKTVA